MELHQQLQAGEGIEATAPRYQRMVELIDKVRMYAEDSWITDGARGKAASVRRAMDRLGRFYASS